MLGVGTRIFSLLVGDEKIVEVGKGITVVSGRNTSRPWGIR
jgi:hypothetical protein